jgi:protein TonB
MTEPRSALNIALWLACALACGAARAQSAPLPSAAASSAAERAQKETDRTMYWIRVLADKPAPTRAAAVPKPVPAVLATTAAREKPRAVAAVAPAPAAATSVVADAGPVPAPLPQAPVASPVLSPANDTPDPTALSSDSAENAAVATAATLPAEVGPPAEPDPGLIQVKSVQPDFPSAIVRRVHKGNVEVRFQVDPAGTVVDATVVESSHARLNDAAVDAVKQWRFKPTPGPHTALVNLVFDIDTEL